MAAISTLDKVQNPTLVGQVDKKTRPAPEETTAQTVSTGTEVVSQQNSPTPRTQATYEETQEVAAKLQSRIDEISQDPHQVSIQTDEDSKVSVIEIRDPEGKVIKQFPPEKVLNLHQKLDDLSGMVIDEMI